MPNVAVPKVGLPHQCPDCIHSYERACELARHWNARHSNRPSFVCPYCGREFRFHRAHQRHIWAHETASERFWARVEKGEGCWIWTGCPNKRKGLGKGYGRVRIMDRPTLAHVFAYEDTVGPVPDGLELDHLCRNVRCVRPDHLEPVTHEENSRRMHAANRAVCEFCGREMNGGNMHRHMRAKHGQAWVSQGDDA